MTNGERFRNAAVFLSDNHAFEILNSFLAAFDNSVTNLNRVAYFKCELDIYYNAMKDPTTVQYDCEQAIRNYIENLPFNGEFSNMAMIDMLQQVDGVRIVELKNAESASSLDGTYAPIDAFVVPVAGYMEAKSLTLNLKAHTL